MWNPPCRVTLDDPHVFPTKKQDIHTLQEGQGFDDGRQYTIRAYKEMADAFKQKWADEHHGGDVNIPQEKIVSDYWDMVETGINKTTVEYANDIDTQNKYKSGFDRDATPESIRNSRSVTDYSSSGEPAARPASLPPL